MSFILGVNAYHGDSSACVVADGQLIAAAEEERFRRVKHWAGFPSESIRFCLDRMGIELADLDHVAINTDPNANAVRKAGYILLKRPDLRLIAERMRNRRKRVEIDEELTKLYPEQEFKATVHHVEHHLAHLASAHLVSPFDESVTVSVDGFGDFSSAAWGVGRKDSISIKGRVYFPHSLGIFYQAMTQYLGFPQYGDEYKVMGLAPYGRPRFLPQMRQIVHILENGAFELNLKYFRHHKEKIEYEWQGGSPLVGDLFSDAINDLLGFPRRQKEESLLDSHRDLARSVQTMYEEALFHLLNRLHDKYSIDSLTLAGGCAMNSVANGKVQRMTGFKRVYVQSAAGDAGGAIGAAFQVASKLGQLNERFHMEHAYWGPSFDNEYCGRLLAEKASDLQSKKCSVNRIDNEGALCAHTAKAIAEGLVVGWFNGRMEWGPRALGNRSIVCDPRRANMKDILNQKIKRRESFRPFAPSILRESVSAWFEEDGDVPFMMQVFQIREEKRSEIPAVTHVDGSGRLQTVCRDASPRYYQLIQKFYELTSVPMVLNTSFNENEPVVCRPEEALDCFLRTKMDVLVMENYVVRRNSK